MIRGTTDNKPFTIHSQEKRPSEVRWTDLLDPCPFCGFGEPDPHSDRASCPNCGAKGPDDPAAWGTESDQAEMTDVLWTRRSNAQGEHSPGATAEGRP